MFKYRPGWPIGNARAHTVRALVAFGLFCGLASFFSFQLSIDNGFIHDLQTYFSSLQNVCAAKEIQTKKNQKKNQKGWRLRVSIPLPRRCERRALPCELNPQLDEAQRDFTQTE